MIKILNYTLTTFFNWRLQRAKYEWLFVCILHVSHGNHIGNTKNVSVSLLLGVRIIMKSVSLFFFLIVPGSPISQPLVVLIQSCFLVYFPDLWNVVSRTCREWACLSLFAVLNTLKDYIGINSGKYHSYSKGTSVFPGKTYVVTIDCKGSHSKKQTSNMHQYQYFLPFSRFLYKKQAACTTWPNLMSSSG